MRRIEEEQDQRRAEAQAKEEALQQARERESRGQGLAEPNRTASPPSAEDVKAHMRTLEEQNRAAEKEQREATLKEARERDGHDRGRGMSR